MTCHNGSTENNYSGPGLENPHPFTGAANLRCTTCHGGNAQGTDKASSHVPPPPQIGDRADWNQNRHAYFNRLTLTGIDKFPDYQVGGVTYTAIDYLQFINPGDLRVVTQGRSCGGCHAGHADTVATSLLATSTGIFSGATYAAGVDSFIPGRTTWQNTAADLGFRAIANNDWVFDPNNVGEVAGLGEYPVFSQRNQTGPRKLRNNQDYNAFDLVNDFEADNRVTTDSHLADLYHEQVAFTCGDCHLGSAGANNRTGDYRSAGCTSCHMRYSLSGRSGSRDPNVDKLEPLDPDDIDPPELAHVKSHRIASVRQTLPSGEVIEGIDDYTCAGCHQGSNRTVMQYWGIRLDQNQDLRRRVQYPSNPVSFQNTARDTRLFDPTINNREFNGRNANQYILTEDYDGDGRDDTPADVHYDAGMGCIDCHGSYDLHGGDPANPTTRSIYSRMDQHVAIQCESCHGTIDAYAPTQQGVAWDDQLRDLAVDRKGNVIKHVVREADGNYYLYSRLTGNRHYVPQTKDVIENNNRVNPFTQQPVYSEKASYSMGRVDGNAATGIGPQQTGGTLNGFSHGDNMNCASCHSSWTNTCMGCHLVGEYDNGNNFSNITGDRIVFREKFADFVYQSPVFFQLGVNSHNKITQVSSNTKVFFSYEDLNNDLSQVFAFSDRQSNGNNPSVPFPALGHNAMMAHSIRGKVDSNNEGPRYCVACHLTDDGLANFGTEYNTFRTAMANNNFAALDFNLLKQHFGENSGNQLDSPLWVHMVAGLGTGLFLFDQQGCPVNPLDNDDQRKGCNFVAPAARFNLGNVRYNLDKIVDPTGLATGSNNHPMLNPGQAPLQRDGSGNQNMAGPLGATLIQRLTDPNPSVGIILNAWLDADGQLRGDAGTFIQNP